MKIPLVPLQVLPALPSKRRGRLHRAALSLLGAANLYALLSYSERKQRLHEAYTAVAVPTGFGPPMGLGMPPSSVPLFTLPPQYLEIIRALVAQLHATLSGYREESAAMGTGPDDPHWEWHWTDEHGMPLVIDPRGKIIQSIALQPGGLVMVAGTNVAGDEEWCFHVRTDPREVVADIIRDGWADIEGLKAVHRFIGHLILHLTEPGPHAVPDPEEGSPKEPSA